MSFASGLTASFLEQNRSQWVKVTSTVLPSVAAFCFALRVYTKVKIVKQVAATDAVLLAALITSAILTMTFWLACKDGLGQHVEVVPPSDYRPIIRYMWASVFLYMIATSLVKVSLILQYLQIFASSPIKKICWGFLVIVCVQGVITTTLSIFTCTPVEYFWTRQTGGKGGHCLNTTVTLFFNASFSIASDIALIVLPIWVIRTLRMPRKQKILLGFIFVLGGFGCITSILRLQSLYRSTVSVDFTWTNAETALWSSAEINTAIICASLASLRPLVVKLSPNCFLGSSMGKSFVGNEHSEVSKSAGTANLEPKSEAANFRVLERSTTESSESSANEITTIDTNCEDMYHSIMKDLNGSIFKK